MYTCMYTFHTVLYSTIYMSISLNSCLTINSNTTVQIQNVIVHIMHKLAFKPLHSPFPLQFGTCTCWMLGS